MMTKVLHVENLTKSYQQSHNSILVLNGLSLEVSAGESLAVSGASGIGKSTLLHCLGLLDKIDQGKIWLDGGFVQELSERDRGQIRQQKIGFVFQFHYLMAELTALENVMVPLMIGGRHGRSVEDNARYWLVKVGLEHRLGHRPAELSGGEQQRVAIARALVRGPKLLLADEPTGNLDPDTAQATFELLVKQCEDLKSALIVATHNGELAKRLNNVSVLKKGRLE